MMSGLRLSQAFKFAFSLVLYILAASAFGQIHATASIASVKNVDNTYTYNITLTNDGTTDIGTFWYAWVPGENFLPTSPVVSSLHGPSGWNSGAITNSGGTDGYGIQWVATTTLKAGTSISGFTFTSTDTPSQVNGNSPHYPGVPVGTSFVYQGSPFVGGSLQFVVQAATGKPAVQSVQLSSNGITGGNSVTGTVTLTGAAPGGGEDVALASDNAAASVPATVTVAAGSTTANFVIATAGVDVAKTCHISATAEVVTKNAVLNVDPAVLKAILGTSAVVGGNSPLSSAILNGKAGPMGKPVTLASSNADLLIAPGSTTIPAQSSSVSIPLRTHGVGITTVLTLTGTSNGTQKVQNITLLPASLFSLNSAPTLIGGTNGIVQIRLNGEAPVNGDAVSLSGSPVGLVNVPTPATVQQNKTSLPVLFSSVGVDASTPVTFTASFAGVNKTASVSLLPASIRVVVLNKTTVTGGTTVSGVVYLNGKNGNSQHQISMITNNFNATVPAQITLSAQAGFAAFTVTTKKVAATQQVMITGSYNGQRTAVLTITP